MGGGLGIILAFLASYFAFIAGHNIAVLWLLALLSFLFASYRVWVRERKKAIAAEQRTVEATRAENEKIEKQANLEAALSRNESERLTLDHRLTALGNELTELRSEHHSLKQWQQSFSIQAINVLPYLHFEVHIAEHNLKDELKFIDFEIRCLNHSVYHLSLESIEGYLTFFTQRLDSMPNIVRNGFVNIQPGSYGNVRFTQPLNVNDAALILNNEGQFGFDHLTLKLNCSFGEGKGDYQLVKIPAWPDRARLLQTYPKLKIEVREPFFRSYFDWRDVTQRGILININVAVSNPRETTVIVPRVRLDISVGDLRLTAYNEKPNVLHESRFINDEGEDEPIGRRLQNIISDGESGLRLEPRDCSVAEGWLQFLITNPMFEDLNDQQTKANINGILTAIDSYGEHHPAVCLLVYREYQPAGVIQIGMS